MDGTALASGLAGQDRVAPRVAPGCSRPVGESFTVHRQVGRLIELQIGDIGFADEVAALRDALLAASASLEGPSLLVADHRSAGPFPQEVGDAWSRAMRRYNGSVERSAILLRRDNETFNLQMARVVRCAGSPRRRWFYDPAEVRTWLAEVMTPAEVARLDEFLG